LTPKAREVVVKGMGRKPKLMHHQRLEAIARWERARPRLTSAAATPNCPSTDHRVDYLKPEPSLESANASVPLKHHLSASKKERGRHWDSLLETCLQRSSKGASIKHGIAGASVVATAVPTTPDAPVAPAFVIVCGTVWISRFDRRTIGALVLLYLVGYCVPSHRGSNEHSRNGCGRADESEICHAYLLLIVVTRMTKLRREQTFRSGLLKDNLLSSVCLESESCF
jgi:hypothetical protein